jgi:hypothetical protein
MHYTRETDAYEQAKIVGYDEMKMKLTDLCQDWDCRFIDEY